jgi:biotin carboxylase
VDFIGAIIKIALDEPFDPVSLVPTFQRPVVQRYAFPTPGRVTAISGAERARALPGIEEVVVSVQIGDVIPEPTHSGCTAAMVLATGDTIASAVSSAKAALATLRIETES